MIQYKFFNRHNGTSTGKHSSLNINFKSQDTKDNLYHNLEIIAKHFDLKKENIALQNQGFSNIANYVETPNVGQTTGDGLVTNKKNILLTISTADCVPVFLYDKENMVIGAVHAGWRSALAGVIENTIDLMIEKGALAENIRAISGPCLQKKSFEAGSDMKEKFINTNPNYQKYFKPHKDIYLFDIKSFIIDKLVEKDVSNIEYINTDTYSDDDYFSYRRSCHKNEITTAGNFGTHASCIVIK